MFTLKIKLIKIVQLILLLDNATKNSFKKSLAKWHVETSEERAFLLSNSVRSLLSELPTGDTFYPLIIIPNLLKHFCGLIKISPGTL